MVFTKAMPAGKESGDSSSSNPAHRTTFRPPWVKDGPSPLPTPAAPWALNKATRRDSNTATSTENNNSEQNPLAEVQLRKIKVKSKEPQEPEEREKKNKILASVQLRKTKVKEKEPQENGAKETFFEKPTLKHVPQKEKTPPKKDYKLHNLPTLQKASERVLKSPPRRQSTLKYDSDTDSDDDSDDDEYSDVEIDKEVPQKRNALVREASMRRISQSNIPAPPPQPGMPPPPPMMPGEVPKKLLNDKQKARIEKLKSRPKVRPDWGNLLQEIEAKKKLKHVVCNDRSSPLLPEAKAPDEHFLYKSEEPNVHNELLRQIEGGIKLKRVKTNDRSKPMLDGLRKFRRQMTIEEQIQKSMSMASIAPEEVAVDEIDEMDDIDKVRDDLQSTKQMLALELRNKEAQERENKRLLARIQNLEAELEKERNRVREAGGGGGGGSSDDKVLSALRKEAEGARKLSQEVEKKYSQTAEELDKAKSQLDDLRRQNQMLEKRLQEAVCGKRLSISDRANSIKGNSEEEIEDTEEDSDGEDTPEKREKRMQKQLKQLRKKLQTFKNKEDNAKKERIALRDIIKKHQAAIKEEKKKYKQLKKEVDKMAALMKDVDEDEEDEEAEEKEPEEETEEEEEEEEESSEEESDSESDDESGSERSQSEDEDAPAEKQEGNLTARVKRHENILNALKKGNFLLKTNAERLQDDLNKQKEMTASLQEDLDSVLSELG